MAFIRYPKHSKGYVNLMMVWWKYSCNVEFLEDEFLSVTKIKKDLRLYELHQDDSLFSIMGTMYTLTMSLMIVFFQCLEDIMRIWLHKRINLRMRFILFLQFLKMRLVHLFKIPHLLGTVGVILHPLRILHLLEIGGEIPKSNL